MAWVALDESIVASQAGHLNDHEELHTKWNSGHAQLLASSPTLSDDYSVVIIDSAAGVRTVTLPATDGTNMDGHVFVIKRSGASNVVINCAGADTFDDAATTKTLGADLAAIGIMSVADGIWYIAGERGTVT